MIANLAAIVARRSLLLLVRTPGTRLAGAWSAIGAVAVAKAFYSPAASAALPNVVDPEDLAGGERDRRLGVGHDVGRRRVARRHAERGLSARTPASGSRRSAWPWPALLVVADPPADAGARGSAAAPARAFAAIREALRLHRRTGRGCWRWSR